VEERIYEHEECLPPKDIHQPEHVAEARLQPAAEVSNDLVEQHEPISEATGAGETLQ